MKIKTILVPLDFSEPSVAALRYAKELANVLRASIHLLHVTHDPTTQPWTEEAYSPALLDLVDAYKAEAQEQLTAALSASERKKYRAELAVSVGAPFSRIIEYATKNHVDLIVMGTHGRGAIAHAILGSVTERVVRFAPCAVLSVPPKGMKQKTSGRKKAAARRRRTN
ncbi:MAG: universal stress protein [Acidobacteria bacterium]|nr:universal stress protein [Acidobacteriota bacterium]